MLRIFVAGIGTGVGKTLTSAILCEALGADYWKPIQSGTIESCDSETVRGLLSNSQSRVHPETYRLSAPLSPHAAAAAEGLTIDPEKIILPVTTNSLVVEGAGGVMTPVTSEFLLIDLIERLGCEVVLVSRNYLGSINHTLLTYEALERRRIPILGLIFNGVLNSASESLIREYTELSMIGRIDEESMIDRPRIAAYATKFKQALMFLHRRKSL